MRPFQIVVPGPVALMIDEHRQLALAKLGLSNDWLLHWILYNWHSLRTHAGSARMTLYTDMVDELLNADEGDLDVNATVDDVVANLDGWIYDSLNIVNYLLPYVGDMFAAPPDGFLFGVEHRPFAKEDTVFTVDLEPDVW